MSNGDVVLESIGKLMEIASDTNSLVVLDTPPGITDSDHTMVKALKTSNVLQMATSLAALIPIKPEEQAIQGALDALAVFQKISVKFDRALIRAWKVEDTSPDWKTFTGYEELAKRFAVWNVGSWMQSMEDMIHQRGQFSDFPGIQSLARHFIINGQNLSYRQRGALAAAVAHLEDAKSHLYDNILAPILRAPIKDAVSK